MIAAQAWIGSMLLIISALAHLRLQTLNHQRMDALGYKSQDFNCKAPTNSLEDVLDQMRKQQCLAPIIRP